MCKTNNNIKIEIISIASFRVFFMIDMIKAIASITIKITTSIGNSEIKFDKPEVKLGNSETKSDNSEIKSNINTVFQIKFIQPTVEFTTLFVTF